MPEFQYTATDADDRPQNGSIEADSVDAARELLEERGLIDVLIFVDDEAHWDPGSEAEHLLISEGVDPLLEIAEEEETLAHTALASQAAGRLDPDLLANLRDTVAAGVPLSAGLRALAEEIPRRRLREGFFRIAERIEAGEPLERAVEAESSMPGWMRGIVHAGNRLGNLPVTLDHCVRFSRLRVTQRNQIAVSLLYPAVMFAVLASVIAFVLVYIVPDFKGIFESFGTEMPAMTLATIAFSDMLVGLLRYWYVSVALIVVAVIGFRAMAIHILGAAAMRRGLYLIPYFGPLFRNGAMAEFCHLMAILVESHVPLDEALQLVSLGVQDANVSEGAELAGQIVRTGTPLNQAAAELPHFSFDLVHVLSWKRDDRSLAEALRGAGDLYSAQSTVSARTMKAVLEPALILLLGLTVGVTVISLFMPLVKLLNDLS